MSPTVLTSLRCLPMSPTVLTSLRCLPPGRCAAAQAHVTSSDSSLSEREVLAEKLVKMEKYIRKNALQASRCGFCEVVGCGGGGLLATTARCRPMRAVFLLPERRSCPPARQGARRLCKLCNLELLAGVMGWHG